MKIEIDDAARADLVREYAKEQSDFTISDVTSDLTKMGIFDDPRHMTEYQARVFHRGAMLVIKQILKSSRLNNQMREFYAYERGAGARWMPWGQMPRRLSRRAYQVLAVNAYNAGRELKIFAEGHRDRFNEDLSSVKISKLADWDPDSDFPVVAR